MANIIEEIRAVLFENRDEKYAKFQLKLMPGVEEESIVGVRTPILRKLAKQFKKDERIDEFLADLPHKYFDENQLHSFIISLEKDVDKAIGEVEKFLPYVNNWATCDQLYPKVFEKNKEKILDYAYKWMDSDETYTIRFGIGLMMSMFLDDDFKMKYANKIAKIRSEEYYVNMMIAWYFATALAKQYEKVLPIITNHKLDKWTNNKAIQKAVESYRITDDQKAFLKEYKIK